MKRLLPIVGLLVVLASIWVAVQALARAAERDAELQAVRNSAVALADSLEEASELALQEALDAQKAAYDSAMFAREHEAEQARRAATDASRRLRETLTAELTAEQTAELDALEQAHEEEVMALRGMLAIAELRRRQDSVAYESRIGDLAAANQSLRMALAAETERADMWKRQVAPGFWKSLTRDLGMKVGLLGIGYAVGRAS